MFYVWGHMSTTRQQNLNFEENRNIPTVYVYTYQDSKHLFFALLNWFKLDHGSFWQRNMHGTLDQSGRNLMCQITM